MKMLYSHFATRSYIKALYNKEHYEIALKQQAQNEKEVKQTVKKGYNYKYNGKELQDELGLNWYDYGARNYDAALGRWMNIDPLGEKTPMVSLYTFVLNNPIFFTDPDGMRVVAKDKDAQKLLLTTLTELLGENNGFYFNKRGILKHKRSKAHKKAKKEYSDEQKAIFDGFIEIASNKEHTIDFFRQEGSDKKYSAEFENTRFVTDKNGHIVIKNGKPVIKEDGTTATVSVINQTKGITGGGTLVTRAGSKNAVAIIFPDIAATKKFKSASGKFTVGSISATVVHEMLDHGIDFVRNGNVQKSRGPSIKNVDYQNKALIIIGSPTRIKHNNE